jgi:hypothetical protein
MAAARAGLAGALVKCWNRSKGSDSDAPGGRCSNGLGYGGAVSAGVAKNGLPAAMSSAEENGLVTAGPGGYLPVVAAVLFSMKSCDGGGVMTSIALGVGSWGDELRGVDVFERKERSKR